MGEFDRMTTEEFVEAAKNFVKISDKLNDGWTFREDLQNIHRSYIVKETYLNLEHQLLRAEYVIFFSLSYGVPSFSFNVWNASGMLLSLEEIRQMAFVSIPQKEFYTVITQQEHPVLRRPYFVMHPCHTAELLATFKAASNNIIVTFLGLITPLIPLKLPMDYGVDCT